LGLDDFVDVSLFDGWSYAVIGRSLSLNDSTGVSLFDGWGYVLGLSEVWAEGSFVFAYSTTDWLGDLYTPVIVFGQVVPLFTVALLDVPTYGSSVFAELAIDYLTAGG
jgi:hypothetical protein